MQAQTQEKTQLKIHKIQEKKTIELAPQSDQDLIVYCRGLLLPSVASHQQKKNKKKKKECI